MYGKLSIYQNVSLNWILGLNIMKKLIIDEELKSLIRPLSEDEYEALEQSILDEGCRDSIIVWHGVIVDGHNRYQICIKHNLDFSVTDMDFESKDEAKSWMIDNQLSRRNLSAVDRIILAQKKTALLEEQALENKRAGGRLKSDIIHDSSVGALDKNDKSSSNDRFTPINVRKETAALAGVSEGTVAKVLKIQEKHPELLDQIRAGEMSIHKAYKSVVPHLLYSTDESEWYTQPRYVEMARSVMDSIDTDPASNPIAQEWIQAKTYYTVADNGLSKDWHGNVWLNPPYTTNLLTGFSEKLLQEISAKHVDQAIVLVNNSTETVWFSKLSKKADALCFSHGRIGFLKSKSDIPSPPRCGQVFFYFGSRTETFAEIFGEIGEIMIPYRK